MAKKQTRRSISVSRGTYERLKAYCETNQISMSQFVERRVGDFLGRTGATDSVAPVSAAAPAASAVEQPAAKTFAVAASSPAPSRAKAPKAIPLDAFSAVQKATSRMAINQPISQAVSAAKPAPVLSGEPLLKDPDIKLTAEQIFTF